MLDIEPTDAISVDEALKDKEGIRYAITGAYNTLQNVGSYGRNQIIAQDLVSDNLDWTGTSPDYSQITSIPIPAENGIVDGIWTSNYDGINRVNNVLAALPDISDISADEKNNFEGEALFLRALFHFHLVTYFGGVPVKTTPTADLNQLDQSRNTEEEVYNQVISDLQAAEQKLPATAMAGRAGSFSATALLARVHLAKFMALGDQANAQSAIEKATQVIDDGGFALSPVFSDLFGMSASNTSEPVFEVVSDAQNRNRLSQYFFPLSLPGGRYEIGPSQDLIQSFEEGDSIRFQASITFDTVNLPYGIKYTDVSEGSDRVIVIRLAEMYLIRAEALAYSNGSIDAIKADIDVVRTRAGLQGTTATDYPSLKLAIEYERRHEFAFEGHRWFDLVRTHRATAVLGIDEKYTLFPIPLSEMQTNKLMTQNPGY
jgi:hypothetical protein